MKTLTENERTLLNSLELHAARMRHMQAVLEMLEEDVSGREPGCEEMSGRLRVVRVLESAAHLAAYYHDEAMRVVDTYYGHQGG